MINPRSNIQPIDVTFALEPRQFEVLRGILAEYSGVYINQMNHRMLTTGLTQRIRATSMSLVDYIAHIAGPDGRGEVHYLVEQILNHETIFFRNLPHMHALRDAILPHLNQRKPAGAPIRLWSAGCSTGEEAYSLAITVLEALGKPLPRPVTILATDLSEAALAKARIGSYRGRTLSNVQPQILTRYFERQEHGWVVRRHVRDLVQFEQLNLLKPFPHRMNGIDIIFCQNVTIYFELATFRNLVDRFYQVLPDGGLLFLGFSETLWNVYDRFRLHEVNGAFIYRKDAIAPMPEPPLHAHKRTMPTHRRINGTEQPRTVSTQPLPLQPQAKSSASQPPVSASPSQGSESELSGADALRRGHELLNMGQANEALTMLYQVPLNGPHAPEMLALIARAHANRGDFDLAAAEAHRALDLNALTTEAYMLLGVLYAQQEHLLIAAQQFERARYLDPDSALVSFHLADVYRQQNRCTMALREYRNTMRKLAAHPPDALLDGVAIGWIRETCERHIRTLTGDCKD